MPRTVRNCYASGSTSDWTHGDGCVEASEAAERAGWKNPIYNGYAYRPWHPTRSIVEQHARRDAGPGDPFWSCKSKTKTDDTCRKLVDDYLPRRCRKDPKFHPLCAAAKPRRARQPRRQPRRQPSSAVPNLDAPGFDARYPAVDYPVYDMSPQPLLYEYRRGQLRKYLVKKILQRR